MQVELGEVVHFDAITTNPTTGAAADATGTPTFEVFEEDTDTAIASGNLTKRTSKTGDYRGTFAASTGNGFEVGKWYSVIAEATVGGVAGKARVMHFVVAAVNVAQTGDSYGIVNHADYGNAKLVRSTTPANALDVSATGEAGLDFSNVKQATAPTTLSNVTVPAVTATGSVTGGVGGSVSGSVGSISGVTFPTNFGLLAIDSSGSMTVGSILQAVIDSIATTVDARLLDAGDATDLIASIVTRIGNTNIDQATLVAAVKSALFDAGSSANKLTVDASGRVTVGSNEDKAGYSLTVTPPTAAQNATAARAELAVELGRLDATVSSRSSHDAAAVKTAMEATGSQLEQLHNILVSDGVISSGALVNAPSGGGGGGTATIENQEAILTLLATHTTLLQGLSVGAGTGPLAVTVVTEPNALVAATKNGILSGWGYADANGEKVLWLTAGVHVFPAALPGFNGNAVTQDIQAAGEVEVPLTPLAVTAPENPDLTNGYFTALKEGVPVVGARFVVKMTKLPTATTTGYAYDFKEKIVVSESAGLTQMPFLHPTAKYQIRDADSSSWSDFTATGAAGTSFPIKNFGHLG